MDLNKFTQKAQQAVLNAQQLAREFNHQTIEPGHLLLSLLNQTESTVPAVVTQIAGSAEILKEEVRKELSGRPKVYGGSSGEAGLSRQAADVLDAAERYAKGMGDEYTSTEHILLGLTDSPEGKTLAAVGVTKDAVLKALREMKRVVRAGETIGLYVWDYPGHGVEFLRAFWDAAAALDPAARERAEDKRFAFCTPEGLRDLMSGAGLVHVDCTPIEIPTVFADFADYWRPFTLGTGPAPSYCASLDPQAQQRLKNALDERLPRREDGSIPLEARAWAVKAVA